MTFAEYHNENGGMLGLTTAETVVDEGFSIGLGTVGALGGSALVGGVAGALSGGGLASGGAVVGGAVFGYAGGQLGGSIGAYADEKWTAPFRQAQEWDW